MDIGLNLMQDQLRREIKESFERHGENCTGSSGSSGTSGTSGSSRNGSKLSGLKFEVQTLQFDIRQLATGLETFKANFLRVANQTESNMQVMELVAQNVTSLNRTLTNVDTRMGNISDCCSNQPTTHSPMTTTTTEPRSNTTGTI